MKTSTKSGLSEINGDYEGLVSFGGISHPIWTDSRNNQQSATGCSMQLKYGGSVYCNSAVAGPEPASARISPRRHGGTEKAEQIGFK